MNKLGPKLVGKLMVTEMARENCLRGSWVIVVVTLGLFFPGPAFGLSCARPSLDETAIDAAIMIFKGTAGPNRSLDFRERAAGRMHAIEARGGRIEDLRIYSFTVTRGWKEAATGQSVDVLFNSYWGDGFAEGEAYLVVSPRQVGNLFWAPLCGHTIDVRHAADIGTLAMLERLIGIGHHMKVRMKDRVCRRAEDCTLVQTHCGECSCGTPVANGQVRAKTVHLNKTCKVIGDIAHEILTIEAGAYFEGRVQPLESVSPDQAAEA